MPSPSFPPSYYALLEVSPDASAEQLRQAFRQLSKRYHPDTTSLPAAEAEQAFQRLRDAYAVLGDPDRRRRYDGLLTAAAPSVSPPAPTRAGEVRRALSGGEWLALLLLGVALLLSLALGLGLAWMRGAELVAWPSWLPPG